MNHRRVFHLIVGLLGFSLVIALNALAQTPKLSGYGANLSQTSVSGLSSGGFMSAQIHVANSSKIIGAGIVAAGPYYCAGSSSADPMNNATATCMNPIGPGPNSETLLAKAKEFAQKGWIDDPNNLKDDKVYIFSGSSDKTVTTKVVDQTAKFYQLAGLPTQNIKYIKTINAGHALITDDSTDVTCATTKPPFINDCDFVQSHDILKHIYGKLNPPADSLSSKIIKFDQGEFVDIQKASMGQFGYVYVPKVCETTACKVHVVFHGCEQGADVIGAKYYSSTGYNEIADTNNMIMLYPQAKPSKPLPLNPKGCWDFWGYSSPDPNNLNFYKKEAPQMTAVMKMLTRLAEPKK
jgi:poly(3-hydroxybutyrate) depolymerase